MTKQQKLAIMQLRLKVLKERPQNIKSGGVVKKLERQILNMTAK